MKSAVWEDPTREPSLAQAHYFRATLLLGVMPEPEIIRVLDLMQSVVLSARASEALENVENVISKSPEQPITEVLEDIRGAIVDAKSSTAINARVAQSAHTVIPGMQAERIESLINDTIRQSQQALSLTSWVNIGVLVAGALIVVISMVYSMWTGNWNAIGFGTLGTAGIMTSLIRNPLRSIGVSARRLVQVQIAYLAFVSQLARLNAESDKLDSLELSKRLGDEMERTLKVLEQYFGQ